MLRVAALSALLATSCVLVATTHSVRHSLKLGANGEATFHVTWVAPPALNLRLDKNGATLERGELGRASRNFSWKRADGEVRLLLRADAMGARAESYFSTSEGLQVSVDTTKSAN
jgi:hypothetical protein